ncbi:hypothetical protein [Tardiphaga robiniae]|uniref:Uncharacterized protein n=1 Tax=Tardiphaga robiniae TaxID=943830 RepID=A0A7G6U4R9_9BRAD|nr:hypothetical protein [Tardiphaga robiniae]QND74001.1 hypothetical protein HB776_24500 [Tardiphaga robiniae]
MSLKDFDLKHWWKMLAAAGALITAASIVPKSTLGTLIGLSLLFFGVGEWMNRPSKPQKVTVEGLQGFRVVDVHYWKFSFLGVIFEIIGVGLFVTFAYMVWVIARQLPN